MEPVFTVILTALGACTSLLSGGSFIIFKRLLSKFDSLEYSLKDNQHEWNNKFDTLQREWDKRFNTNQCTLEKRFDDLDNTFMLQSVCQANKTMGTCFTEMVRGISNIDKGMKEHQKLYMQKLENQETMAKMFESFTSRK